MSAHESDVVNLAGLLYAALVGRWPGTEGSTVPPAPAEHGRPAAAAPGPGRGAPPARRDLRAGAATPVRTPTRCRSRPPTRSYAALSDYIGDPTGAPQYDATTILDTGTLSPEDDLGPATQLHPAAQPGSNDPSTANQDTGDLAATGAFPAPARPDEADDQTQAGVPVFYDEDTAVGWMSETWSRGLTGSPAAEHTGADGPASAPTRRAPAPPPPLPDAPERPLFADGPARRTSDPTSAPGDTGSFVRSTGAGNGRVPAAWGPDVDDPDDDDWTDDAVRPGTSWLRLAAVLAAGDRRARRRDQTDPALSLRLQGSAAARGARSDLRRLARAPAGHVAGGDQRPGLRSAHAPS